MIWVIKCSPQVHLYDEYLRPKLILKELSTFRFTCIPFMSNSTCPGNVPISSASKWVKLAAVVPSLTSFSFYICCVQLQSCFSRNEFFLHFLIPNPAPLPFILQSLLSNPHALSYNHGHPRYPSSQGKGLVMLLSHQPRHPQPEQSQIHT